MTCLEYVHITKIFLNRKLIYVLICVLVYIFDGCIFSFFQRHKDYSDAWYKFNTHEKENLKVTYISL